MIFEKIYISCSFDQVVPLIGFVHIIIIERIEGFSPRVPTLFRYVLRFDRLRIFTYLHRERCLRDTPRTTTTSLTSPTTRRKNSGMALKGRDSARTRSSPSMLAAFAYSLSSIRCAARRAMSSVKSASSNACYPRKRISRGMLFIFLTAHLNRFNWMNEQCSLF